MKKYILGTAALLALAACSNDDIVVTPGAQEPTEGKEVSTVQSNIVGNYDNLAVEDLDAGTQIGSRAGLDANLNATWTAGDELSISNGTLMYSYNVTKTFDEGKTASFNVAEGHAAHTSDGNDNFYAIYPRRAITEANGVGRWNGSEVKGQIFAQQSYIENMGKATNGNNFGGYYITTKAAEVKTTNNETQLSFSFTPLASVVDVDLSKTVLESGDAVAAVYLRDMSNKTIAANFSYDCNSHALTTTGDGGCDYNYTSRSNVVEVSFFESEDEKGNINYTSIDASNKVVRFYILPVKLNKGVEITIRTKNGKYYTKKASASVGTEYTTEEFKISSTDKEISSIVKPYYKKYNFGTIEKARKGAWMSCIPQNVFYTMLSVPGSHDAATSTVKLFTFSSKTQNKTIAEQLELGVRALDLRPSATDNLEIKHGSTGTGVTLAQAIESMRSYLEKNPTEFIYATIHLEGSTDDNKTKKWSNNVYKLVKAAVDGGYALGALSKGAKLADYKGKIIFIYRDDLTGDNQIYNAAKVAWNDNIARTVKVRGTNGNEINDFLISYQDIWESSDLGENTGGISGYFAQKGGVKNDNDKVSMVKKYIDDATGSKDQRLIFNFASYSGGFVSDRAKAIMPSVNSYIVSKKNRLGVILADFVDATYGGYNFTAITTANNFKYVYTKRSRIDYIKKYKNTTGNTGVGIAGDEYADGSDVFAKPHKNF